MEDGDRVKILRHLTFQVFFNLTAFGLRSIFEKFHPWKKSFCIWVVEGGLYLGINITEGSYTQRDSKFIKTHKAYMQLVEGKITSLAQNVSLTNE